MKYIEVMHNAAAFWMSVLYSLGFVCHTEPMNCLRLTFLCLVC